MAFLTLLFTFPLIYVSYDKTHETESLYILKLIGIWFLSQLYVTINNDFVLPFGMLIAIVIVYKTNLNRNSKFLSLVIGIIGFVLSTFVYFIYKT
jgi:TctA family transporter